MSQYWKLNTQRIQSLVDERRLKHYWLAECAGVHRTTLRRWLAGQIERVHTRRLDGLACALEVRRVDIAQRC